MSSPVFRFLIVTLAAIAAIAVLGLFWSWKPESALQLRVPGTDAPPGMEGVTTNPVLAGKATPGEGKPAQLPGAWPSFRGASHDGISAEPVSLLKTWPAAGPKELWSVTVGEGYGGASVLGGRVFLLDYDREKKESVLRCLSLADGREIWRYAYPLSVKRNHGITRTVPAVTEKSVVAIDPKCNVLCVDTTTGKLKWGISLTKEYGTVVPPWYAGQCPLIEGERVILAPAGPGVLMMAVELETGKVLWKTPNPREWKMTHVSVVPMEFAGQHFYLYCGSGGVAAVSAKDGALLWDSTDWKISIATVATPVPFPDGRIFFSGGYNAGCLMMQLSQEGGKITPSTLWKAGPEVFGATQQSPVVIDGLIFGIRPDGQFVCVDPEKKKTVWASGREHKFALGPFLAAGGLFFAMDDDGKVSLFEMSKAKYAQLAQAEPFKDGHEAWAPMAIAGGRLLLRDFTRLICLDVSAK